MKVLGSELNEKAKREALARFVHRFTLEHIPSWAKVPMSNGRPFKPQFKDDNDWLNNTYFYVNKNGTLSKKHNYCESNPTWPQGMSDLA